MRKRSLVILLSVLAAIGLAGGAFAASHSGSHRAHGFTIKDPEQAIVNDVARRLHVTPAHLTAAFKQALIDQVNRAVAAGHLPRALAKAIKQRIEHSPGVPFGPGFMGPCGIGPWAVPVPGMFGPPGLIPPKGAVRQAVRPQFGPPLLLTAAARYLGLTDRQLMHEVRSGKSLSQVAKAHGKTESGLEHAIIGSLSSQLNEAVKAGRLPRIVVRHLLDAFTRHIGDIVSRKGAFAFPFMPVSAQIHAVAGSPPMQVLAGGPPRACGPWTISLGPPRVIRSWVGPPNQTRRAMP